MSSSVQLCLLLPLCGAVLIGLCGRLKNLRETVTLLTAAGLVAAVVGLAPSVFSGHHPHWIAGGLPGGLLFEFSVEPLGLLYALVAAVLWVPNSVYSIGYMRAHHEEHQTRFYMCFALALASAMGVAFSGNLFTMFVCYEALSVVTYPLVTHHGTPEAKRAGRIYIGFLFSTSMLLFLLGILLTWTLTGTTTFALGGIVQSLTSHQQFWLFLLFMLGIGKAALMPFHFWLPAAMVAPTPVSALLHAVAVVKAGVFCVLKVAVYVFGIKTIASGVTGPWLMDLAAATILIASLVAWRQDNLKLRLAYSTVSQLSYIILGAALGTAYGVVGGGFHIAMHAFGKITLFFCAGAIYVASGRTKVSELAGMGKAMPFTFLAFAIASLSIIGIPPMGGAWSKWYLGLATLYGPHPWLLAVLLLSSLLNVAYLLPIPIKAFFSKPESADAAAGGEAPWPCVLALSFTALGTILLFFFSGWLYRLLELVVSR